MKRESIWVTMNEVIKLILESNQRNEDEISFLAHFRGLKDTSDNKFSFEKDSLVNQEVAYKTSDEKWAKCFAGKPLFGLKIDPLTLEPFVARYVNAINAIGVKTFSSCDGWHKEKSKNLTIGFKERYSLIWHQIICERMNLNSSWSYFKREGIIKLPKSDKDRIKKYIVLNKDAEILEKNQTELLELKRKVVEILKGKQKAKLSDQEIKFLLEKTIEEIEQ